MVGGHWSCERREDCPVSTYEFSPSSPERESGRGGGDFSRERLQKYEETKVLVNAFRNI